MGKAWEEINERIPHIRKWIFEKVVVNKSWSKKLIPKAFVYQAEKNRGVGRAWNIEERRQQINETWHADGIQGLSVIRRYLGSFYSGSQYWISYVLIIILVFQYVIWQLWYIKEKLFLFKINFYLSVLKGYRQNTKIISPIDCY